MVHRRYPVGNRLFHDLDKMVDLERTLYGEKKDESFNLTGVLIRCHMNYTVYEVCTTNDMHHFKNVFNIRLMK